MKKNVQNRQASQGSQETNDISSNSNNRGSKSKHDTNKAYEEFLSSVTITEAMKQSTAFPPVGVWFDHPHPMPCFQIYWIRTLALLGRLNLLSALVCILISRWPIRLRCYTTRRRTMLLSKSGSSTAVSILQLLLLRRTLTTFTITCGDLLSWSRYRFVEGRLTVYLFGLCSCIDSCNSARCISEVLQGDLRVHRSSEWWCLHFWHHLPSSSHFETWSMFSLLNSSQELESGQDCHNAGREVGFCMLCMGCLRLNCLLRCMKPQRRWFLSG